MSYPIWFIRHGDSEGSAVLVRIRESGSSNSSVRLLTVQHGVRSRTTNPDEYGKYADTINAWAPEFGFNPQRPIKVVVDTVLSPTVQNTQLNVPDIAFLSIIGHLGANDPVPLLPDIKCKAGLARLTVAGFSGGDDYLRQHRDLVVAPAYSGWKFQAPGAGVQDGTLVGPGGPEAGASGGGVFRKDQYAGLYRGKFPQLGGHLFIPINSIRNYLAAKGYELVDPPAKLRFVNKLQQNIPLLIGVVLGLITMMWAWTHPHPNMISLGLPLSILASVLSVLGLTKWLPSKRLPRVRTILTAIAPLAFLTFVAMSGIAWKWRIVQINYSAIVEVGFTIDKVQWSKVDQDNTTIREYQDVSIDVHSQDNICIALIPTRELNSKDIEFKLTLKSATQVSQKKVKYILSSDREKVQIGIFHDQLFEVL